MLMAFDVSLAIFSISVRSFVRPRVLDTVHILDDARFRRECQSVDNLFERRASNVSHLRNRASERARASVAAFWISHLFRACPLYAAPRPARWGLTFFGDTVVAVDRNVY